MIDEAARAELAAGSRRRSGRRGRSRRSGSSQTPQGVRIRVRPGREVLNFCANNYLGLASHPRVDRGRARGAGPLGLRHVLGALHLRHAGGARRAGEADVRSSWARRTPSCTPPASTPTAASSSRSWTRTAPSSPTSSTTPPSSTARGCARRGGSSTRTPTWRTWRRSCAEAAAAPAEA